MPSARRQPADQARCDDHAQAGQQQRQVVGDAEILARHRAEHQRRHEDLEAEPVGVRESSFMRRATKSPSAVIANSGNRMETMRTSMGAILAPCQPFVQPGWPSRRVRSSIGV